MGAVKNFARDLRESRTCGERAAELPNIRLRADAYRNTRNDLRLAASRYSDPVTAYSVLMREAVTAYQEKRALIT